MDPAECFTITWKIKKFSFLLTNKAKLGSPNFGMMSTNDSERWKLMTENNVDKITFYMYRLSKKSSSAIYIRNHEISIVSSEDNSEIVLDKHVQLIWKLDPKFLNEHRHLFLPGDTLTVRFRIYKQGMKPRQWLLHSSLYSDKFVWEVPTLTGAHHNRVVLRNGRPQFDLKLYPGKDDHIVTQIYGPFIVLEASNIPDECKHQLMPTVARSDLTFLEDRIRLIQIAGYDPPIWYLQLKQGSSGVLLFELSYTSAAHRTEVLPTDDFLSLYRDPWLSDVTLRAAGGESFPVHRAVLGARSPVFRTMFSRCTGVVDIDDLDAVTLDRMLAFLYGDVIVEEMLGLDRLYCAAHKYGVRRLQLKCADMLAADLSVSSVCGVLALADRNADRHLAEHAFRFVRDHEPAVVGSEEWGSLQQSDPALCATIVRKLEEESLIQTTREPNGTVIE